MKRSVFLLLLHIALCVSLCGCEDDAHKTKAEHTIYEGNVNNSSEESDAVGTDNFSTKRSSEIEESEGTQEKYDASDNPVLEKNNSVGEPVIEEIYDDTKNPISEQNNNVGEPIIEECHDNPENSVLEQNNSVGEPVIEKCYDDLENPVSEQNYSVGEPKYE